jgi:hypothetical protein
MSTIFPILALKKVTPQRLTPFMLCIRAILQDTHLRFAWPNCLKALGCFCSSVPRIKVVFEDFEFHSELNQFIADFETVIAERALSLILAYLKLEATRIPLNFSAIVGSCASPDEPLALTALRAVQQSLANGLLCDPDIAQLCQILKGLFEEGSFAIKVEAMKVSVAVLRVGSFAKCVELNFMEDFIGMIESEDEPVFQIAIGGIARILNRSVSVGMHEPCWRQFCDCGGVEVLERLTASENVRIADRSTQFLKHLRLLDDRSPGM